MKKNAIGNVALLNDGDYYIAKRLNVEVFKWGVYRIIGGKGERVNAFDTELHARIYAAAQMIAENRSY